MDQGNSLQRHRRKGETTNKTEMEKTTRRPKKQSPELSKEHFMHPKPCFDQIFILILRWGGDIHYFRRSHLRALSPGDCSFTVSPCLLRSLEWGLPVTSRGLDTPVLKGNEPPLSGGHLSTWRYLTDIPITATCSRKLKIVT